MVNGEGGVRGLPEFVKVYGAGAVGVEHANHHAYSVGVEGRPVTVYKSSAEFGFGEGAAFYMKSD